MRNTGLRADHAKFVAEYLVDGNGVRAAVAAGYSQVSAAVTAHRLLRRDDVRTAIEARQRADAQRLGVERQDVLRSLLEAAQMAREQRDAMALIAATRELGRLLGFYPTSSRRGIAERCLRVDDPRYLSNEELARRLLAAQCSIGEPLHHGG